MSQFDNLHMALILHKLDSGVTIEIEVRKHGKCAFRMNRLSRTDIILLVLSNPKTLTHTRTRARTHTHTHTHAHTCAIVSKVLIHAVHLHIIYIMSYKLLLT